MPPRHYRHYRHYRGYRRYSWRRHNKFASTKRIFGVVLGKKLSEYQKLLPHSNINIITESDQMTIIPYKVLTYSEITEYQQLKYGDRSYDLEYYLMLTRPERQLVHCNRREFEGIKLRQFCKHRVGPLKHLSVQIINQRWYLDNEEEVLKYRHDLVTYDKNKKYFDQFFHLNQHHHFPLEFNFKVEDSNLESNPESSNLKLQHQEEESDPRQSLFCESEKIFPYSNSDVVHISDPQNMRDRTYLDQFSSSTIFHLSLINKYRRPLYEQFINLIRKQIPYDILVINIILPYFDILSKFHYLNYEYDDIDKHNQFLYS